MIANFDLLIKSNKIQASTLNWQINDYLRNTYNNSIIWVFKITYLHSIVCFGKFPANHFDNIFQKFNFHYFIFYKTLNQLII